MKVSKRVYTVKEAAHYLGRTIHAVRYMIRQGKFAHIKDGRRVMLDIKDLESWIEKSKELHGDN